MSVQRSLEDDDLDRFWRDYHGRTPQQALDLLASRTRPDAVLTPTAPSQRPVDNVDRPVRSGDHLAGTEQRIARFHQFELFRDFERRPILGNLVGPDELTEDVGIE